MTFRGLRTIVDIELAVQAPPVALVRVFGLALSRVNQLTRAGINWEASENTIMIQAGDAGGQLKSIFEGLIFIASPEYNSMPETSFVIMANSGRMVQMKPVAPNSFKGSVSAETVIGEIVQSAGYTLENNGVSVQLDNPYFPGTAWTQLDAAAQAARCFFYLDPLKKTVAIWQKTGSPIG